jgi:Mg-chelatase subunit ChlD
MKGLYALILLCCVAAGSWAGGEKETQEVSPARAQYLAERGTIIPTQEVQIDSLIGAIDYAYPEPEHEFGVDVYTGHRQVATSGQQELVLIGVQGRRLRFEDLAPLNLVLVVDKSGSMRQADKLEWVKESAEILLSSLRDQDYLSLVVFDAQAHVVVPSSSMKDEETRRQVHNEVQALVADGDSNIADGLAAGFREARAHLSADSANRVLLLTDGWGKAAGVPGMVKRNREQGIEVSVVGFGTDFDAGFAEQVYKAGGGSTRFISDRDRMQEVFGRGLARTTVPLARDIKIEAQLKDVVATASWGMGSDFGYGPYTKVHFTVPTLHSGDQETALLALWLPAGGAIGTRSILTVQTRYKDLKGAEHALDPITVTLEFVQGRNPIAGISDGRVLKAGTMLRYALAVQGISATTQGESEPFQAFYQSFQTRNELRNAETRLGDNSFAEQIGILESYMRITGGQIGFKKAIVEQIIADIEILPPEPDRPLQEHLGYLFRELVSRLNGAPAGALAVSGFSVPGKGRDALAAMLDEAGASYLTGLSGSEHPVVERQKLDEILREQELALSDLVDPAQALRVGKILAAHYLVTGTIIPMSESVVIFGRIIDVETAVIEAVAQVIIPRSKEIDGLL